MNCFHRIASQLAEAGKHQRSVRVSLRNRKPWAEFLDGEGHGQIIPQAVAGLFSPNELRKLAEGNIPLASLAPAAAEKVLCKKYREYKRAGFLARCWMRITRPISLYRQVYTLVTLRNLQHRFAMAGREAASMARLPHADVRTLTHFFDVVMGSLGACHSSLFPSNVGFFTRIFGSKKMFCHVSDLKKFRKEAYRTLKDTMKKSYAELAMKAHASSTQEEQEKVNQEVISWFNAHAGSIEKNIGKVNAKYTTKYRKLRENLQTRSGLLSGIAEQAVEKMRTGISENPAQETRNAVDREYQALSDRIANLDEGCTVQFENRKCRFNHTYVLDFSLSGWKLDYWKTPDTEPVTVRMEDVKGLGELLSQQTISKSDVRKLVSAYHQQYFKPDSASSYYEKVLDAAPERRAALLFGKYTRLMEKRHIANSENNLSPEAGMKKAAKALHAFCDYLEEKNSACLPAHAKIMERATLYLQHSEAITKKAAEMKIHCADRMVYEPGNNETAVNEYMAGLEQACSKLQEDFLQLPPGLAGALQRQAGAEIKSLKPLADAFRTIHLPKEWKLADLLDVFAEKPEWEDRIEEEFSQAWQGMEIINDIANRKKLDDIARSCFYSYALQPSPPLSQLGKIYDHAEKMKVTYLKRLEQETRAIVPAPEIPVQVILKNLSHDINQTRSMLQQEFDAALISGASNTRCGWVRMTKEPDTATMISLSVCFDSAYVAVEKLKKNGQEKKLDKLYYLDLSASGTEQIELDRNERKFLELKFRDKEPCSLMSEEEAITMTRLTARCPDRTIALYSTLLELIVLRLEGVLWGKWERNILKDMRCGLVHATLESVKRNAEKLPWSHYIFTPENKLYYYCKQKGSFEKAYLLEEEIEKFREQFPGKKHVSLLNDRELKFIGSLCWARTEEFIFTSKEVCEMARAEISELTRKISVLYHPQYSRQTWQAYINAKKDDALKKLYRLRENQQMLTEQFDLLNENVTEVPEGLVAHVPQWISHGMKDRALDAARNYCILLRRDNSWEIFMEKLRQSREEDKERKRKEKEFYKELKQIDAILNKKIKEHHATLDAWIEKAKARNNQFDNESETITEDQTFTNSDDDAIPENQTATVSNTGLFSIKSKSQKPRNAETDSRQNMSFRT